MSLRLKGMLERTTIILSDCPAARFGNIKSPEFGNVKSDAMTEAGKLQALPVSTSSEVDSWNQACQDLREGVRMADNL